MQRRHCGEDTIGGLHLIKKQGEIWPNNSFDILHFIIILSVKIFWQLYRAQC
jgi:hypothetical protein